MITKTGPAALAALFALSACSQSAPDQSAAEGDAVSAPAEAPSPGPATDMPPPTPDVAPGRADGVNDGYPDLTPVQAAPDERTTEKAARAVLLPFARALELREFDQAWAMMDENGHEEWSKAEFNKLFKGLDRITVSIPGGRMEGAAGSSYYSSPATITASDAAGRPVAIEGPIVLKRVNDVPGATKEQLEWRVHSADFEWTH